MKKLFTAFLIVMSTQTHANEAEKIVIQAHPVTVQMVKALLDFPEELTAFNEKTELKSISISNLSPRVTVYTLSGKRRGIGNGGFRELRVIRKSNYSPDQNIQYEAHLVQ